MKKIDTDKLVKDTAQKLNVLEYLSYKNYLSDIYESCKTESSLFSFMKYSTALGFEETNVLWLFTTGKRKVSLESAKKIAIHLKLSKKHEKYFLSLVQFNNAFNPEQREKLFKKLVEIKASATKNKNHKNALEYFSEWYNPIIRELSYLKDFQSNPEWIQEKLFVKLRPIQIKKCLELLLELGYLHQEPSGQLKPTTTTQIVPDSSSKNIALVSYHKKICEVTRDSISSVPEELRDLNTLTVSISDKTAEDIKKLIHELCGKIMAMESADTHDQKRVYQYNLQAFALTKSSSSDAI